MNSQRQKKHRNRKPVSCWPCRERKVRCDQASPCATCRRRGHVHICRLRRPEHLTSQDSQSLYGLPTPTLGDLSKRTPQALSESSTIQTTSPISVQLDDSRAPSDDSLQLISLLDQLSLCLKPTHEIDNVTKEKVYLGRNCAANVFRALNTYVPDKPLLPTSISVESAFGLTNRTTLHPFGSLWSYAGDVSLGSILQSLPAVEVCLR